jgi:hypothetical protein
MINTNFAQETRDAALGIRMTEYGTFVRQFRGG